MFMPTDFRKITGVALDADTSTMEKRLGTVVKNTAASEIATALIVRTLVVEHGWKVSESAANVGLSASAAGVAGSRGKVLWETGPDSALIVWQTLKSLPSGSLTDLATHLQTMTTEADRTEYVVRLGIKEVTVKRLGDKATPEAIASMVDALAADGHRTPVSAKSAVAGVAGRLGIELPKATRPGTPANKSGSKADVPTFDAAMAAALVAIEQAYAGADADNPVMLTPDQSKLADDVMAALARLIDVAKVAIPA